MSELLFMLHHGFGTEIRSFVLMVNHFHLLARFPLGNISPAMMYFMRESSKRIGKKSHKENHLYGGRFHRCRIANQHYFNHAYKYNYRNPVSVGIAKRCEEYPFSTLNGLLGQRRLYIPVQEDTTLFSGIEDVLQWLNAKPVSTHSRLVRCALKQTEFCFPDTGVKHPLEFLNY